VNQHKQFVILICTAVNNRCLLWITVTVCTPASNKCLSALLLVPHNNPQHKCTYIGRLVFVDIVSSARLSQRPDNDRRLENKFSQMACIQLPWLCLCSTSLGTCIQTAQKSTAFIMAVCPSVNIYHSGLHWTDSRQIW